MSTNTVKKSSLSPTGPGAVASASVMRSGVGGGQATSSFATPERMEDTSASTRTVTVDESSPAGAAAASSSPNASPNATMLRETTGGGGGGGKRSLANMAASVITPPDHSAESKLPPGKQVRFNKNGAAGVASAAGASTRGSSSSSAGRGATHDHSRGISTVKPLSKGLVSRRGGRHASPRIARGPTGPSSSGNTGSSASATSSGEVRLRPSSTAMYHHHHHHHNPGYHPYAPPSHPAQLYPGAVLDYKTFRSNASQQVPKFPTSSAVSSSGPSSGKAPLLNMAPRLTGNASTTTSAESDTVPSLCSTSQSFSSDPTTSGGGGGGGTSSSNTASAGSSGKSKSRHDTTMGDDDEIGVGGGSGKRKASRQQTRDSQHHQQHSQHQRSTRRAPKSINVDTSKVDTTSPLTSHDPAGMTAPTPVIPQSTTRMKPRPMSHSKKSKAPSSVAVAAAAAAVATASANTSLAKRRSMTPPPPKSGESMPDHKKKTPTRSPVAFQSLPSLKDAKLSSPCGIFLSPNLPSPSAYDSIAANPSFEEGAAATVASGKPSPKLAPSTDADRARAVATPTDFASMDFGRPNNRSSPSSFDASNVLAWLQSPTANGLFSPGGFGSIANTPRGGGGGREPRTPRTPTVSSFFFSDVASLPTNAAELSDGGKRVSSMICISPLASSKRRIRESSSSRNTTPSYRDVFASPTRSGDYLPPASSADSSASKPSRGPRGMPMLGDSPAKGTRSHRTRSGGESLDAVSMAERDLMEDEDLNVLLRLASQSNTPRDHSSSKHHRGSGGEDDATAVFRSPRIGARGKRSRDSSLPGLQLPIIGNDGSSGGMSASRKLSRKSLSRDHSDTTTEDFNPPQLGLRSNSDLYSSRGSSSEEVGSTSIAKPDKTKSSSSVLKDGKGNKDNKKSGSGKSKKKKYTAAHPPYYPHGPPEAPFYHMPPMTMPPGGSMRVVVDGGTRNKKGSAGSGSSKRSTSPTSRGARTQGPPFAMPPHPDGSYPALPYPPHPHAYPPHMPPPMGVPPPYAHYPPHMPPPSHMPMYAAQHPPRTSKSIASTKTGKKKSSSSKSSSNGGSSSSSKDQSGGKSASGSKRSAATPITPSSPSKASFANSGKTSSAKKQKKSPPKSGTGKKKKSPVLTDPADRQKAAAQIQAVNAASGGKNDKAAALAAAILRGVTMRPSGKWQAQLYYAGKSRYIGVFDTREKAALAYEIAREKLKSDNKSPADQTAQTLKQTENAVNAARKAAFDGVNGKGAQATGVK